MYYKHNNMSTNNYINNSIYTININPKKRNKLNAK